MGLNPALMHTSETVHLANQRLNLLNNQEAVYVSNTTLPPVAEIRTGTEKALAKSKNKQRFFVITLLVLIALTITILLADGFHPTEIKSYEPLVLTLIIFINVSNINTQRMRRQRLEEMLSLCGLIESMN